MKKPIYIQIEEYIISKIRSNEYEIGDLIPTEKELTKKFNTSRSTVNKALLNLTTEGYLFRTPGRGSVVRSLKPKTDFSGIMEITKNNTRLFADAKRTVIKLSIEAANNSNHFSEIFESSENRNYIQVVEIISKDNQNIGVETTVINQDLVSLDELTNLSVIELIKKVEMTSVFTNLKLSASLMPSQYSSYFSKEDLQVPVLKQEATSKLSNGSIIKYVETLLFSQYGSLEFNY